MMGFPKLVLLVLSIWGVAFFAQTEASTSGTWTRDQTYRSLLQTGIPASCNAERNVRWYDRPAPTGYRNFTSPGECCEFCQQTPGCRAWVWRSIGSVCYLLDTVGEERYCYACTGGIPDEPEPVDDEEEPIDDDEIDDTLQRCADDGGTAARAAATAACIVLTNTCVAAQQLEARLFAVQASPTPVQVVLDRSCEVLFTQTCRSESFRIAEEVNPACAAILDRGPGAPTRDCEGINEARRIFNDQITELCAPPN